MVNKESAMRIINVDASHWKTSRDLYETILPALGAPDWHGENANALVESMVWGEINAVEPPYTLRIHSTAGLPDDVAEELGWIREDVKKARAYFRSKMGDDSQVKVEIVV